MLRRVRQSHSIKVWGQIVSILMVLSLVAPAQISPPGSRGSSKLISLNFRDDIR